jgi:hypothetical protein
MEFGFTEVRNLYVKVIALYLCVRTFRIFIIDVESRKSLWQVAIIMSSISLNAPAHNSRPCSRPGD